MHYFRVYCILLLSILLSSCSKHTQNILCDSPDLQSTLLHTSIFPTGYYSISLNNMHQQTHTNTTMSCQATATLHSNLDSSNILSIPISYNLYQVSSPSQPSISPITLTTIDQQHLQLWLDTLNGLVTKLGDYQSTPYGALYIINESIPEEQKLYFNGIAVNPDISNTYIKIEKSYQIPPAYVFIISSYTGGTIDADTRNNIIIQINKSGQYQTTQYFAYQTITPINESLIITGKLVGRPYAESTDFPIYNFYKGQLNIIRDVLPESYYKQKFAGLSAQYIIHQAKSDNCFNIVNNLLDTSHACKYGIKYCFEYQSIKESSVNAYNKILKTSCN